MNTTNAAPEAVSKPKTPCLNYARSRHEEKRSLLAFLEWLESQGIQLNFERADSVFNQFDNRRPLDLIDRYLEIDSDGCERERRAMLETI